MVHSTITSWGREREVDAYRNMLRQFGKPGAIVAVVSDSYDIYRAISEHWGTTLRDAVIASGATLVIRPDSGDPVEVVAESLRRLDEAFGHVINGKGYRVLNHVRVIQGDGINPDMIRAILQRITYDGYAADNIAFGMGGALLQRLDRDTQKFALKCSAARSEEHTSELQSQSNLVCRLLLEKKKNTTARPRPSRRWTPRATSSLCGRRPSPTA